MPILTTDLTINKALGVGGLPASNGGGMSSNIAVDASKNNIFPDITQSERVSGATTLRKLFLHNSNINNLPYLNTNLFIETITTGDDAVYIHTGSSVDTEANLTGAERLYGAGTVNVSALGGVTSLEVLVEAPTNIIFADGDTVRVSNKPTVSGVGVTEYLTIAIGGVSLLGNVVTLTFTTATANAYNIGDKVASVITTPIVKATVGTPTLTSATGVFSGAISPQNLGGTTESWSINFISATAFTITGTLSGGVGTGSVSTGAAPLNPSTSTTYFDIAALAFGGVFVAGDTISFSTVASSVPFWVKRIVPTGAAVLQGTTFSLAVEGEG